MTLICGTDTETTSLRPDRRAWEVGLIVRQPGQPETPHRWFVRAEDLDLGNADPNSLKIGRFYERHPDFGGSPDDGPAVPEEYVLRQVEKLTRGAHLVGAVVNFDDNVLGARMRANGILPAWNYHLIEVENLAAGWLNAYAARLENGEGTIERATQLREIARPPWDSAELSRAVGVDPADFRRHEALEDVRWALAIHDAVMGRTP